MHQPKPNSIPTHFQKVAGKLSILTPLKTCVSEKVGALTPLGVKSGKYNGTQNFGGVKNGHFPSHFFYTTDDSQR